MEGINLKINVNILRHTHRLQNLKTYILYCYLISEDTEYKNRLNLTV